MQVYHRVGDEPFSPATPFDDWAAVEVSDGGQVPEGMELFRLPGGTYAVFTHRGPASSFSQTAQYIYGVWLPESAYELDERPHFAVMGANYRPDDPDAEEDFWIPIVEQRSATL